MAVVPRDANFDFSDVYSKQSRKRSFLTFVNKTHHDVDIIWIDFNGRFQWFKLLRPGEFIDTNTFAGHPWIARSSDTLDQLLLGGSLIYYPNSWAAEPYTVISTQHMSLYQPQRLKVPITLPVFTLREVTLQKVQKMLQCPEDALNLDIPMCLRTELYNDMQWITANRYGHMQIKLRGH